MLNCERSFNMWRRPTAPKTAAEEDAIRDRIKLIRKLRWIGMEEDAKRLSHAISSDYRGSIIAEPVPTD